MIRKPLSCFIISCLISFPLHPSLLDNRSSPLSTANCSVKKAFKAIEDGDFYTLKTLIDDREFDINSTDSGGLTALHYACEVRNVSFVKILLEHSGINPNLRDCMDDATPLEAVFCSYSGACRSLYPLSKALTPLEIKQLSDIDCYEKIIDLFLAKDKELRLELGTCLTNALRASHRGGKNYFKILLKKDPTLINASIGKKFPHRRLLHFLCLCGRDRLAWVKQVLAIDGIDPNKKDDTGQTASLYAIKGFSLRCIEALLAHTDAKPFVLLNNLDPEGYPPVLAAYKQMKYYSSHRVELKEMIHFLLNQNYTDIRLLYSVILQKEMTFASEDTDMQKAANMIKDKIVFYNNTLLCRGVSQELIQGSHQAR